jgi:hypothetical protein
MRPVDDAPMNYVKHWRRTASDIVAYMCDIAENELERRKNLWSVNGVRRARVGALSLTTAASPIALCHVSKCDAPRARRTIVARKNETARRAAEVVVRARVLSGGKRWRGVLLTKRHDAGGNLQRDLRRAGRELDSFSHSHMPALHERALT